MYIYTVQRTNDLLHGGRSRWQSLPKNTFGGVGGREDAMAMQEHYRRATRKREKNALARFVPFRNVRQRRDEGARTHATRQSRTAILRTPPTRSPRTEREDRSINDDLASALLAQSLK